MIVWGVTAACCLLGAGSMLCTWLGRRLDSVNWLLRGGELLVVQVVALAIGLLAAAVGFVRDIYQKRGLRAYLKRLALLIVMAVVFVISCAYHVAVTGGV